LGDPEVLVAQRDQLAAWEPPDLFGVARRTPVIQKQN
jgi:hypothetical protein